MTLSIRPATDADWPSILDIIKPVLAAGETYAIDTNLDDAGLHAYWMMPAHKVFVAELDGQVVGTYYLMHNQRGGGAHVANCGYMTSPEARGQGVARTMCLHSLDRARERGFRAMQFNHVVSTNEGAVALWQKLGFQIVGTLPQAFRHPLHGYVDSFVMFRAL
ncbi:GNAT family N-acetyltransferase [Devosia sp. XJ19-1]|uniref:GNAT family N-acetyltransferase n=1 Tax=Devosia ureilytica TaxID=2952754 RepID=A0A9Q4AMR6_9HYPH|nr:GNAT family N-acetyltransferase [Devosia ureilytica]MCP8883406.1 GNAT family N-acetyltransferase [Devosia ureilytica]MCP8887014.1 GNAT family N-acetyltransferase [Devosia ureilytica]